MASDYGKWFICTDGSMAAIKCTMERFMDCLKDLVGSQRAAHIYHKFRKATFTENCRLEIELTEK